MRQSRLLAVLIGLMASLAPLGLLLHALLPAPAAFLAQVGVAVLGIVTGAYLVARLQAAAQQEECRE